MLIFYTVTLGQQNIDIFKYMYYDITANLNFDNIIDELSKQEVRKCL